jgi:F-type H+-transporting ATPase subunit a
MKTGAILLAIVLAAAPLAAQVSTPPTRLAQSVESVKSAPSVASSAELARSGETPEQIHDATGHWPCEEFAPGDIITPHITDSHCLEVPSFPKIWEPHEVVLPRWKPIVIGHTAIDLSPTKHVVMLLFAAFLCCVVLIGAARSHVKHTAEVGRPKTFASGIEAMVLFIRQEVALKNLGHHGEGYVPLILCLFFFILFANLLGLIPFGSTATGNISVTATLAILTFFVVEFAGIRAQGPAYLNTIFYWNTELPLAMRIPMFVIMTPIEIVGKLTKPFALAIRLFANMTAGHIVVLALIGLIFTFQSYFIGIAPALMAVAIMMLELFVAFLQAFIFALLASVFIGQIREGAH